MAIMRSTHPIYTIGYAAWSPEGLRAAVDARRALLVDIRERPRSWRPEWRQVALRALWGLDWPDHYAHWPALGNVNYKNGGPILLADPAASVSVASAVLARQPIVLLCGCYDHARCHRLVAADYLSQALGARIEHLYPSA